MALRRLIAALALGLLPVAPLAAPVPPTAFVCGHLGDVTGIAPSPGAGPGADIIGFVSAASSLQAGQVRAVDTPLTSDASPWPPLGLGPILVPFTVPASGAGVPMPAPGAIRIVFDAPVSSFGFDLVGAPEPAGLTASVFADGPQLARVEVAAGLGPSLADPTHVDLFFGIPTVRLDIVLPSTIGIAALRFPDPPTPIPLSASAALLVTSVAAAAAARGGRRPSSAA